jgi:hypothetical protein
MRIIRMETFVAMLQHHHAAVVSCWATFKYLTKHISHSGQVLRGADRLHTGLSTLTSLSSKES